MTTLGLQSVAGTLSFAGALSTFIVSDVYVHNIMKILLSLRGLWVNESILFTEKVGGSDEVIAYLIASGKAIEKKVKDGENHYRVV